MKLIRYAVSLLILSLGVGVPLRGQADKQDDKKVAADKQAALEKRNKAAKRDKPAGQQQKQSPQPPPQRSVEQARMWQQRRGWLQQGGGWKGREAWQQARADKWSSEHRTWAQRGGYGGFYVPPDRWAMSFGDQHSFRLTRPTNRDG